jgi:hypothetical protein
MWLYVTWTIPSDRVMVAKAPVAPVGPVIMAPVVAVSGGHVVAQVPEQELVSAVSFVRT